MYSTQKGDKMKPSKMKLARIRLGISQTKLSKLTGISQQKISNIERGLVPKNGESIEIALQLKTKPGILFKVINQ